MRLGYVLNTLAISFQSWRLWNLCIAFRHPLVALKKKVRGVCNWSKFPFYFPPTQTAVTVLIFLPHWCGIHIKLTLLYWVRRISWCMLSRLCNQCLALFVWLGNVSAFHCHSEGDETGTVALLDTKNPDSVVSSAVHSRSITGFAFSAHRYDL